jgi:hypothetical protein
VPTLTIDSPKRNRFVYAGLVTVTIALGLGSRIWRSSLPSFIGDYAGDVLWTVCLFFCLALILSKAPTWKLFCAALIGSLLVELSQLYHAPWVDELRGYKIIALMIGSTFVWSDLVCYFFGAVVAGAIDIILTWRQP